MVLQRSLRLCLPLPWQPELMQQSLKLLLWSLGRCNLALAGCPLLIRRASRFRGGLRRLGAWACFRVLKVLGRQAVGGCPQELLPPLLALPSFLLPRIVQVKGAWEVRLQAMSCMGRLRLLLSV